MDALIPERPFPGPRLRVARRRRYPVRPEVLWTHLADPRDWASLFVYPEGAPSRRVKMEGGRAPRPGIRLHVLAADRAWTRYEIVRWEPERQVRLVATETGSGHGDGVPVRGERVERLILIPQGGDTEAEWTLDHRGALLARLISAPSSEAWGAALEARLDALGALVGVEAGAGPEDPSAG